MVLIKGLNKRWEELNLPKNLFEPILPCFIDIDDFDKDLFFDFLEELKYFFDQSDSEKLKYAYTGIERIDGKAGLGYTNRDIENGACKESFCFNLRNDTIPFSDLYLKFFDRVKTIGFDFIENINSEFLDMHDDQPLIRFHKYYAFEDIGQNETLRFTPHIDYGTITICYQFYDIKGFQYKLKKVDEKWIDFPFNEYQLLAFNGTLMEDFGSVPTFHRVINNDISRDRYSFSVHFDLKQEFLEEITIKERLGA